MIWAPGWTLGGHLGSLVSALVDGQLSPEATERAWSHVLGCTSCRRLVEREGWVKRQLAQMSGEDTAPAHVVGSLQRLHPLSSMPDPMPDPMPGPVTSPITSAMASPKFGPSWSGLEAWAAVDELEHKGRGRRRAGLALVGAGSVSAAVLGMVTLGAPGMSIGGSPAGAPASSLTRTTPTAAVTPVVATSSTTPRRQRTPAAPTGGPLVDPADEVIRNIVLLTGP